MYLVAFLRSFIQSVW
jgi:hypothetical protein